MGTSSVPSSAEHVPWSCIVRYNTNNRCALRPFFVCECVTSIYTLRRWENEVQIRNRLTSLQGHLLWQAGRVLATYLTTHRQRLVQARSVLELGAGAGLPSLVCALNGAATVVCTDYPDLELVKNLKINVDEVKRLMSEEKNEPDCNIIADGYLWGADVAPLLKHLIKSTLNDSKFDLLVLGDLLFNHSEHNKLLLSVRRTLARRADARALVFFTPYRPWLFEKDMAFFDLARRVGSSSRQKSVNGEEIDEKQKEEEMRMAEDGHGAFVAEKVLEHVMDEVMFEEDRGDELLRRTVSSSVTLQHLYTNTIYRFLAMS